MRCAPPVLAMLVLGGVSGCVPLFYAYPAVSYVPAVNVGKTHEKTYAFRVDIADHLNGSIDGAHTDDGRYLLRQIHVAKSGYVAGQAKLALDSGYYWNCFITCFQDRTNHTVRLRFYRPGYNLVEVHSWQTESDMVWREVPEPEDREKVLDALLGPSERGVRGQVGPSDYPNPNLDPYYWYFEKLAPGSASVDHRCALMFAAREYEQIAGHGLGDPGDEVSERCLAKAKWLRDLAAR